VQTKWLVDLATTLVAVSHGNPLSSCVLREEMMNIASERGVSNDETIRNMLGTMDVLDAMTKSVVCSLACCKW